MRKYIGIGILLFWFSYRASAGGVYSPTDFYRGVGAGGFTNPVTLTTGGVSVVSGGQYSSGSFQRWYRINGTNTDGRLPTAPAVSVTWTGATNLNAVSLSWTPVDGVKSYVVEMSDTGGVWTNWTSVGAATPYYTDRGTNAWFYTVFTNVHPTVIPSYPVNFRGASRVSLPDTDAEDPNSAATKQYVDDNAGDGTDGTFATNWIATNKLLSVETDLVFTNWVVNDFADAVNANEEDPGFAISPAGGITSNHISGWNAAVTFAQSHTTMTAAAFAALPTTNASWTYYITEE